MSITTIKNLSGYYIDGLNRLWDIMNTSIYDILDSVWVDFDVIFAPIINLIPNFSSFLTETTLIAFMLGAGFLIFIWWTLATWFLNIVT